MEPTYSLEEVAAKTLPKEWVDGVRWLARRINRGEIDGYRVGHKLRMTEQQVKAMIDRYSTTASPAPAPAWQPQYLPATSTNDAPLRLVDALSPQSRRRLGRSA